MNAQKQKVIDYARTLYCEVDQSGKKKHTLQKIAQLIHKKYTNAQPDHSVISRWAKKYDFEDTFIKLKQAGVEKAKGEIENKIINEKADIIADIYKSNKQIQKLATNTLLSRMSCQPMVVTDQEGKKKEIKPDIDNRDLVFLLQHSEKTLLVLQDKGKNDDKHLPTDEIRIGFE